MSATRDGMEGTRLANSATEVYVRIAIHPHHENERYHLPHQGMWFVILLFALLLLLGKSVAA
jgi:hypothetical protein